MILLQIIAAIALVPMTAALLFLFNFYLLHRVYLFFMACYFIVYALLFGFIIYSLNLAWLGLGLISLLYGVRLWSLMHRLSDKKRRRSANYPVIQGKINAQGYRAAFLFPLSFMRILKFLPFAAIEEFMKKTGLDMTIPQLVDFIMIHSLGTHIEIISEGVDIYIEIKE